MQGALRWGIVLAVVEAMGRASRSDVTDLLLLVVLITGSVLLQTNYNIFPVAPTWKRLQTALARLFFPPIQIGVDFWDFPPLPRGIPTGWMRAMGLVMLLAVCGSWFPAPFASGLRAVLHPHVALLWLTLLGAYWACLIAVILFSMIVVWDGARAWLARRRNNPQAPVPRVGSSFAPAVFLFTVAVSCLLPSWVITLGVVVTLIVLQILLLSAAPGLVLLWRLRPQGILQAVDGRFLMGFQIALVGIAGLSLTLLADPAQGWLAPPGLMPVTMPVTLLLGRITAGTLALGMLALGSHAVRFARLGIVFNPRRIARQLVRRAEWKDPDARRRWEIRQRRNLMHGLKRLFKFAAGTRHAAGMGFWIAPQHWYIQGLTRDSSDREHEESLIDRIIGPPFHRVIAPEARFHFGQVTQSLAVDLILVEDGISFRRFSRVIRVLFEIYDMHGGMQQAEDRHFLGLPGVKVMLHDFDLTSVPAWERSDYPEPEYDEVGRARILHIFKDRGEFEELAPVPEDWKGVPVGGAWGW
jgi:hypothetical protein